MDGNNRWSKKNSKSTFEAYQHGANKLMNLSQYIFSNTDVKYISAFALSRNNLNRSIQKINTIKKVLGLSLNKIEEEKLNFNIKFIGEFDFLENQIINKIKLLNQSNKFKKTLYIFLNYGGREDIEKASFHRFKKKGFDNYLYTKNLPDPDLLIRSGGYSRLSNFMLYQIAFTELFFLKKLWPDLTNKDLNNIFNKFKNIKRNFGK